MWVIVAIANITAAAFKHLTSSDDATCASYSLFQFTLLSIWIFMEMVIVISPGVKLAAESSSLVEINWSSFCPCGTPNPQLYLVYWPAVCFVLGPMLRDG